MGKKARIKARRHLEAARAVQTLINRKMLPEAPLEEKIKFAKRLSPQAIKKAQRIAAAPSQPFFGY